MRRTVSAHLELEVHQPAVLALLVAVANGAWRRTEQLTAVCDGRSLEVTELAGPHGTRLHRLEGTPGKVLIDYRAEVDGVDAPAPVEPLDLITYLRPSRYAESDRMIGLAHAQLGGLHGVALLQAVEQWVGRHVAYVSGSSGPTDGASQTVLSGHGVCRDFAHVTVTLLRALDVPARLVAVYAPGLTPMDFHAVAEAYADGRWHVLDATGLAPRESLVRISTGRDAADTAFLSTHEGRVTLLSQEVSAVVDGDLPLDDRSRVATLH